MIPRIPPPSSERILNDMESTSLIRATSSRRLRRRVRGTARIVGVVVLHAGTGSPVPAALQFFFVWFVFLAAMRVRRVWFRRPAVSFLGLAFRRPAVVERA